MGASEAADTTAVSRDATRRAWYEMKMMSQTALCRNGNAPVCDGWMLSRGMAQVTYYHHQGPHNRNARRSEACIKRKSLAPLFSDAVRLLSNWPPFRSNTAALQPTMRNWDCAAEPQLRRRQCLAMWCIGWTCHTSNGSVERAVIWPASSGIVKEHWRISCVEFGKSPALETTNNIVAKRKTEDRAQATREAKQPCSLLPCWTTRRHAKAETRQNPHHTAPVGPHFGHSRSFWFHGDRPKKKDEGSSKRDGGLIGCERT